MLVIRLARKGTHKVPFYHINLADRRRARDGRFIENLGFYNPLAKEQEVHLRINTARMDYWLSKGAKPSETVGNLIKRLRKAGAEQELLGKDKVQRRVKRGKKAAEGTAPSAGGAEVPSDSQTAAATPAAQPSEPAPASADESAPAQKAVEQPQEAEEVPAAPADESAIPLRRKQNNRKKLLLRKAG